MATTTYTFPSGTTASQTNGDTYLPSGGAWINTRGASSVTLLTQRTADTGTATFQAFAQFFIEHLNSWTDLLDFAGTAVQGVQYADNAWDSATAYRLLTLMENLPPGATAGKLTYGTNYNAYQVWIPERIRFRFRHGGTGVTNTFSAVVQVHTAQ